MPTITYTVPGMHCASCPKLITMSLEEMKGVTGVDARLEDKIVAVMYDDAVVDEATIRNTIKGAGYDAEPLSGDIPLTD